MSKGDETRKKIERAMLRVKYGKPLNEELKTRHRRGKLEYSISAVALEAGISAASIHNNYPDLAEKIRLETGKEARSKVADKNNEIRELKEKNRELRNALKIEKEALAKTASINLRLQLANDRLKAIQGSQNVVALGTE